jgi:hemoglobin
LISPVSTANANNFATMKDDIQNREDLMQMVSKFYDKLLADPTISYLFTDVAKLNLAEHLPVLVDFWDMVLFEKDTYRKNAMQPHLILHQHSPFTKEHFNTWLLYFKKTVDELFDGDVAYKAKERATSIATVMQIRIAQMKQPQL